MRRNDYLKLEASSVFINREGRRIADNVDVPTNQIALREQIMLGHAIGTRLSGQ